MRRLTSILIVTGAVLAVAQTAVAQFVSVPITVTSQTLKVGGLNDSTGDVVGGSSVATTWNFDNGTASSSGTVSSVLTNGELVLTIDGAISRVVATGASINLTLIYQFEFFVPDIGESMTQLLMQLTRTSSVMGGTAESLNTFFGREGDGDICSSQLLGGLIDIGYLVNRLPAGSDSLAYTVPFLPTDTITCINFRIFEEIRVEIDNSTGTFSETYTFRAITPTPVPEPSASLAIPSGIGMLYALSKLRGVSLIH